MKRFAIILAVAASPSMALAGGFEFLGNGAEVVGRGGAFTAKADDLTAVENNVAGLARQRGTRLQLEGALRFGDYTFQRSGVYPDAVTAETPYGGQPYPKVSNSAPPFFGPMGGLSTDFGYFDRWTFGLAVYGPSSYGKRAYGTLTSAGAPLTNGTPSPQRYDVVSTDLFLFYPTLAAAVRVTKWLELGAAFHLVVGIFNLSNVSLVDLGRSLCPTTESATCDSTTNISTTGVTASFSFGAMFHPLPALSIGLHLKGNADVDSTGTIKATAPPAMPIMLAPGQATFHAHLPWVLRLGVRYAFMKDGFERGDVEVDGTYEAWAAAEGTGDSLDVRNLSFFKDFTTSIEHHFQDTFSVRVGGAYNFHVPWGVMTLRLGFYYDSSATRNQDTRIDFDTMEKYAPTAGLAYRTHGITFNLGYAYLYSPDRTVTNGTVRIIQGTDGSHDSATNGPDGKPAPLPVVNNGVYHASTQVLTFGATILWDELLKKKRVVAYE